MENQAPFDAVVVGGGLSGLSASVKLAGSGYRVGLFDKAPRLGGRCYSFTDRKTGDLVENGQHLLVGAYHNLLAYLDIIGTRQHLSSRPRSEILLHDRVMGRFRFSLRNFPKPFNMVFGLMAVGILQPLERLKLLRVGLALYLWGGRAVSGMKNMSVDQWLTKLGQSEGAKRYFWNPVAVSIMNESTDKASAFLFATALRETFLGGKDDSAILTPRIGQSELYADPAVRFLKNHGAEIFTSHEIVSIDQEPGGMLLLKGRDGDLIRGKSVILAVPPGEARELLPERLRDQHPYREFGNIENSPIISVNLWFDDEFMDVDSIGLIGSDFHWFFNRRRIIRSDKKGSFISGVMSAARHHIDLPNDRLVELAMKDLSALYPEIGSKNIMPSNAVVIKERNATFSATAETLRLRPGARSPIGNLFFAGDWTDTDLPATIEGAVMSGFRASENVISLLSKYGS